MKRKNLYLFTLFTVLMFFGCASVRDGNEGSMDVDIHAEEQTETEEVQEDTKPDVEGLDKEFGENNTSHTYVSINESFHTEDYNDRLALYEGDIMEYIDSLTDDMLDAYDEFPSFESYWNDPIVFLNKINDDLRLYGIHTEGKTAMLLYVQGEKVFVQYGFQNHYAWEPELNYSDIDSDGVKEIIISDIIATGNVMTYELIVCDYEDTWNVYHYDDYLQDIEKTIQWRFDEEINTIIFMDKEGNALTEQALPEWTSSYPFAGGINYEDWMSFDANTMLFCVTPLIGLENSLPYSPIEIVFNVVYKDGEFELGDYYIRDDIRDTY